MGQSRKELLDGIGRRTEPWDVVVIGGGATGAGCALDAASRGLSVLLLDQHDFGKGTSSRSTKLVHGGVRYLAQGNISLVREGLKERGLLLKNAPHVVHRQGFIVPCYGLPEKFFYGTGLKLYDLLSGKLSLGRSRLLSRKETLERLPSISSRDLSGGVLYFDGQFDDTRLLIDILCTAAARGAAVLNYARVDRLEKDPTGRIAGLKFIDTETGEAFSVGARSVINAAGIFCDSIRKLANRGSTPTLTFSQGVHLVFDKRTFPSQDAMLLPKTSDGRVLFVIPWHDHILIGTTDTPIADPAMEPRALDTEIDFILGTANRYLSQPITRKNILSVFAGIRPLVGSRGIRRTSALSRGHRLEIDEAGLVTITGGKWTTYRRMAEDAVTAAVDQGGLPKSRSVTADLPIDPPSLPAASSPLLHPDHQYTEFDVIRAVENEFARTVEDVLARRTRMLFLNAMSSIETAPRVAEIMASLLGKDTEWVRSQLEEFKGLAANYKVT